MRPKLNFLTEELVTRIVDEALEILAKLGVEMHDAEAAGLLAANGAEVISGRMRLPRALVERSLKSVPAGFRLYNTAGEETHHLAGDNVYFTPGSAALNILDFDTGLMRRPKTADYVEYAKLVSGLEHIAAQSTAMIPDDVPAEVQDSYRLYLSLLYCAKPVVTGCFTAGSFGLMRDMQVCVRGSAEALEQRPLTVFSCCPTAPLKWSAETARNVVDCARAAIPVEFISMPLSGFMAPVTLVGTLVQHAAETLSGVVISQLARPGAPILWGGSPAIFDVRRETTPMGAIETMMLDCAYSEIGHHLGMPTQAYIGLSDAKLLDAQAGLETGVGATLAALSGINSVSGPGMLDFESCQSLEKLVLDNEVCGMAMRLARGIEPRDDFPALPLFDELLREKHLLISRHTRKWLKTEHYFPGPVIDRANRSRWQQEGSRTLKQRARGERERLVAIWRPPDVSGDVRRELTRLMAGEARRFGMDRLPALPE
uniref:Trimethylamine methyltransferase n=1 Tax=candidate division WOR-3 bacterium TaxID=2052148 RepID=A0A7C4CBR6_UNCW3